MQQAMVQRKVGATSQQPEIDITASEIVVEPTIVYKNDETATIRWAIDEESTAEVEFGKTITRNRESVINLFYRRGNPHQPQRR